MVTCHYTLKEIKAIYMQIEIFVPDPTTACTLHPDDRRRWKDRYSETSCKFELRVVPVTTAVCQASGAFLIHFLEVCT